MNSPAWHERSVIADAQTLSDSLAEQELLARQIAGDVAAARTASAAIKAITQNDFTPLVAAQLVAVLTNRIAHSTWSHFPRIEEVLALLDDSHDILEVTP